MPVLAGGVGGAVLTNLTGEWRLWRANRREDRTRFNPDRLAVASEISKTAADAMRLQVRRLALRARKPVNDASVAELDARYQVSAETIAGLAASFGLLFPAEQRTSLKTLLDALDALTTTAGNNPVEMRTALEAARSANDAFADACRRYLVGITDG